MEHWDKMVSLLFSFYLERLPFGHSDSWMCKLDCLPAFVLEFFCGYHLSMFSPSFPRSGHG